MTEKKAAHENPLIPNARLRQMYRAILRAHLLGWALPPAQRDLTAAREAVLVSTSLDLTARDLVLDAVSNPVIDFLRGMPLHRAIANHRVPHPSSARVGSWNVFAGSGSPSRLISPADPTLRIHAAVGAAAALKSATALTKSPAKKSKAPAHDSAVILACAISGEVPADTWKPALAFAAEYDLPVIFVALPSALPKRTPHTTNSADFRTIAHRARVPAMPVDAADPVALYRVAQESIGHARIGGGPALIECVAFPTDHISRSTPANPALAHLEQYILERGIATRTWMDREAASFTAQVRSLKSASK